MRTITICSFAKLNLTFEILDNLPGGYHGVRTVFQSVDLADQLVFSLSETEAESPFSVGLTMAAVPETVDLSASSQSNIHPADFPLDDNNLIVKAAMTFEALTSCGTGKRLDIVIDKKIPIAAGMAGGSGNAAAALRAMECLFPNSCSSSDADLIASQLGSDINFCLHGGTQVGTNRGEILRRVHNSVELTFLIVKLRSIGISTPWIFRKYDESIGQMPVLKTGPDRTADCCEALAHGSLTAIANSFYNDFENVCFNEYPDVAMVRNCMLETGCLSANITGSGPTLFGLVSDFEDGLKVQQRLLDSCREKYPALEFDSWVTQSVSSGLLALE